MRKIFVSIFVFFLTFFAFSVTRVSAAKILTSDKGTVTVAKGEVVNDDLFIGAATTEIDGVVNGDIFIGAQTVKIAGTINGSLHVGTQSLSLENAFISGNVYAGSQNITVTGTNIKGSLITGTQTLNIDKASAVNGSIIAGVAVVTIDSQVKRNVIIGSGMLTIGDNARIGRDLYYATGSNQANISGKAKIVGVTHKYEAKTPEPQISQKQTSRFFATAKIVSSIVSYLGALIIGLILMKLFAKRFTGAVGMVSKSFWKSLGIGFLVIVSIIPALIILLITVIGIPLAGLALIVLILYIALSKIVVGAAVGNWIATKLNWNMDTFWPFALGLLIIYVLKLIPVAGGLVGFMVMLLGIGALILQTSKAE
jgi:hypothetical protein